MAGLSTNRFVTFIVWLTYLTVVVNCHGHAHDEDGHAHVMHEKPSFRYSRQANEPYAGDSSPPDTAGHHHGHSHGEHGHSHGKHGHAHVHEHYHEDGMGVGHRPSDGWRDPDHPSPDSKYRTKPKPPVPPRDNVRLWLEALGATVLISLAPFAILFVVRVDNTAEHEPKLKVLLAFASGGLLGDAFLHLIPHAILAHSSDDAGGHTHSHGHTHGSGEPHEHDLGVWLWVLVGFCAFLIVEKFVRIVKGSHHHSHSHGVRKPATSDAAAAEQTKTSAKNDQTEDGDLLQKEGIRRRTCGKSDQDCDNAESDQKESPKKDEDVDSAAKAGGDSPQKKEGSSSAMKAGGDSPQKLPVVASEDAKAVDGGQPEIKVAGYLNLVADCIHNFTDGLAIGASFLAGEGVGIITTVTVLFHEVPHEIGDYAILIQSGCSRKQAMLMQLVTALGAVTGTLFSLVAEGVGQLATAWILPFTAGGFIYIAAVSVIPELLENSTFWQSVWEILALVAGVAMMVVIAYIE